MPMEGDRLLEDRSLQAIIEDIQAQFETGGIYRPARVTESVLRDRYGLADDQVEDYYGYYSTADGYADNLLAVKARAGQIDAVKRALEMYREDLMAAMEKNGIGYAYDRARNMQVITRATTHFWLQSTAWKRIPQRFPSLTVKTSWSPRSSTNPLPDPAGLP